MRVFLELIKRRSSGYFDHILEYMVSSIERISSDVDWEEFDRVFVVFLFARHSYPSDKDVRYSVGDFLLRYVRMSSRKFCC